ncbi:hypothetical protein BDV23DRAFT_159849 [Aspergillus alliaceus]|uniref:Uncharacterized protein n=1 Tax=Petromyces alliaceus TaxID=209559 RepID=A0A5N7C2D0_PETAA|nr:hypothetical protein BDV23DRAFT_159849 [Aspergillus alliaceus]
MAHQMLEHVRDTCQWWLFTPARVPEPRFIILIDDCLVGLKMAPRWVCMPLLENAIMLIIVF